MLAHNTLAVVFLFVTNVQIQSENDNQFSQMIFDSYFYAELSSKLRATSN